MATKTTSPNQAIMSLGFSVSQAKAIVEEANRRGMESIQWLAEICDHAEHIKQDAELLQQAKSFLAQFIPEQPKSAGLDKIRSILGGSMPPVPSATAPAPAIPAVPAVDDQPRYFNGQSPFSSEGKRLAWVISSNYHTESGVRFVNIGLPSKRGMRTIGMSAAAWEELLTVHRDELLREIRKLG